MDVILHLGVHGTATRRFQGYMEAQSARLSEAGLAFWGPQEIACAVRSGGDTSSTLDICDAAIDVGTALSHLRKQEVAHLFVSDADVLGTLQRNLDTCLLYPDAGTRAASISEALGASVSRVVICPRSLELYWCAAVSNGVLQGAPVPDRSKLRAIADNVRSWRDVISDIANALPGIEMRVLPFERFAGQPNRFFARAADLDAPCNAGFAPVEAAPMLPELRRVLRERGQDASGLPFGMGRWNPFTNDEHAALRERYADDLMWLTAGADGLATLTENREAARAGQTPPSLASKKGRNNELEERQMARPG